MESLAVSLLHECDRQKDGQTCGLLHVAVAFCAEDRTVLSFQTSVNLAQNSNIGTENVYYLLQIVVIH